MTLIKNSRNTLRVFFTSKNFATLKHLVVSLLNQLTYSFHQFQQFSRRTLPLFGMVTTVVVLLVVVVVVVWRGSDVELFPIIPLNVAHMITDEALS